MGSIAGVQVASGSSELIRPKPEGSSLVARPREGPLRRSTGACLYDKRVP